MRVLIGTLLLALSVAAGADVYVRGYFRKDGTYVQPHRRSNPNGTTLDNYSAPGNINPYTGNRGSASGGGNRGSGAGYGRSFYRYGRIRW